MRKLVLAPMEGLIDDVMREVLTSVGGYSWCVTEFIRVSGTLLPLRQFLRVCPELRCTAQTASATPVRVQLLGSDPVCMAENAARLAELAPAGIDLNFGCPAPTVNRHRGGAVLLDEPQLLYAIASAVRRSVPAGMPFTAKMRLGVRDTGRAVEAAQALAAGGVDELAVHARTKLDAYRPPAHWPWIARIAEAVHVPVIANGEIWDVEDALRCRTESGCMDIMLGRGAVADPFLGVRLRHVDTFPDIPHADLEPATTTWHRCLLLIAIYWHKVQAKVEPRHAPGRLKQWLNLLRRTYPQAERMFREIRLMRHTAEIDAYLQRHESVRNAIGRATVGTSALELA